MSSCDADVIKELKRYNTAALRTSNMMIKEGAGYKLLKMRCGNSVSNYSKSSGYRFLVLASQTSDHVYLITVYPKKGKFATSNLTDDEINRLLTQFAEAHDADSCNRVWPVPKAASTPNPRPSK
jgi:hypothetical protein